MSVRRATEADLPALETMWRTFAREVPPAAHLTVDEAVELKEIREIVGSGLGFVHEEDARVTGFALARANDSAPAILTDLYVDPSARRRGVAAALVAAVADAVSETGADQLELDVDAANPDARAVY